jgi:hypothetical protein
MTYVEEHDMFIKQELIKEIKRLINDPTIPHYYPPEILTTSRIFEHNPIDANLKNLMELKNYLITGTPNGKYY